MHFRMIPFTVPQVELPGMRDFLQAFTGRQWAKGPEVCQLEGRIAGFVGVKYAAAFASGRYCLYLLYKYFGCFGKRVVVPAYTCIPAADAFRWAGAEPFFVDIDPETYNLQYDSSIQNAENIGAVCLSYLYGLADDPAPFINWARSAGIPIIEDAAIALGAKIHGKMAGSIGDAAVFSLQSSKIITGWRGGVITTNNPGLYKFLRQHQGQQHGPSSLKVLINGCLTLARRLLAPSYIYSFTIYPVRQATLNPRFARLLKGLLDQNPGEGSDGYSSRELPDFENRCFTNAQAKLALSSLKNIDNILALRRRYAAYLIDRLREIRGVSVPASRSGIEHAYGRFPIRINGAGKLEAAKAFARLGVEVGRYYPYIIPDTQYFQGKYNINNKNFPNACKAANETILLPFHSYLQKQDLDRIVTAVHRVAVQQDKKRVSSWM